MTFHPRNSIAAVLAAGVVAPLAVAGLAILANVFPPASDEGLFDRGQRLEATFAGLEFAKAFAYGEVIQKAYDTLSTSVITRLPKRKLSDGGTRPPAPPRITGVTLRRAG